MKKGDKAKEQKSRKQSAKESKDKKSEKQKESTKGKGKGAGKGGKKSSDNTQSKDIFLREGRKWDERHGDQVRMLYKEGHRECSEDNVSEEQNVGRKGIMSKKM